MPVTPTLDHINRGADAIEGEAARARGYAERHRELAAFGDGTAAHTSLRHAAEFDRIAAEAEAAVAALRRCALCAPGGA